MDDDSGKVVKLMEMLHQRTIDRKITWERTEEDGVYQASLGTHSVRLATRDSTDEETGLPATDYLLRIYDAEGALVDEYTDVQVFHMARQVGYAPNTYDRMRELYSMARRLAMGVDKALDSLLDVLGQMGEPKRR